MTKSGHVDYLVNNALPIMRGIDECSYEEFQYALAVGVTAPFYLTKLLMPYFASFVFPYRKGFASLLAKKSTSGPMKNAVIIVPAPITAPIPSMVAPERK